MLTKVQKSIFEFLFFFDCALGISRFLDLYQTAKIRRLLKKSHRGLKIQRPITIQHPECVEIGQGVSMAAFLHIWGGGGVKIGDRVLIASHVAIVSETHDPDAHPMNESFVRAPVRIEDDVWIGAHSVIFPGVVLGRGSVVGAGSIVTRDVEPFSIVAGVPAKVLRKRKNNLSK
jgi:acetyltransferase-like isoleucine patch superfamily enzyme